MGANKSTSGGGDNRPMPSPFPSDSAYDRQIWAPIRGSSGGAEAGGSTAPLTYDPLVEPSCARELAEAMGLRTKKKPKPDNLFAHISNTHFTTAENLAAHMERRKAEKKAKKKARRKKRKEKYGGDDWSSWSSWSSDLGDSDDDSPTTSSDSDDNGPSIWTERREKRERAKQVDPNPGNKKKMGSFSSAREKVDFFVSQMAGDDAYDGAPAADDGFVEMGGRGGQGAGTYDNALPAHVHTLRGAIASRRAAGGASGGAPPEVYRPPVAAAVGRQRQLQQQRRDRGARQRQNDALRVVRRRQSAGSSAFRVQRVDPASGPVTPLSGASSSGSRGWRTPRGVVPL